MLLAELPSATSRQQGMNAVQDPVYLMIFEGLNEAALGHLMLSITRCWDTDFQPEHWQSHPCIWRQ